MIAARILLIGVALATSLGLACEASPTAAVTTTEARGGNCASCHMPEYTKVADPVHVDVKPLTCAVCHVQDGWRPSAVHHEWSPLTGAHAKAPCSYCHKGTPAALAVLKGTPTDCVTCHRPEYDASPFPNHDTFPTKCIDCHTTNGWRPATHPPPPPPPPPPVPVPLPTTTSAKGPTTKSPKSPPTSRPVPTTPPPPRTPPPRPPPDVITRPSGLHR